MSHVILRRLTRRCGSLVCEVGLNPHLTKSSQVAQAIRSWVIYPRELREQVFP